MRSRSGSQRGTAFCCAFQSRPAALLQVCKLLYIPTKMSCMKAASLHCWLLQTREYLLHSCICHAGLDHIAVQYIIAMFRRVSFEPSRYSDRPCCPTCHCQVLNVTQQDQQPVVSRIICPKTSYTSDQILPERSPLIPLLRNRRQCRNCCAGRGVRGFRRVARGREGEESSQSSRNGAPSTTTTLSG